MGMNELWLITAYFVGSISSYFLFKAMYTDFITGKLIRVLEEEGLIRVERNDSGELDIRPAGLDYDEFLERLAEDLEQENEERSRGEDKL
jgi:hypothetical protein